MVHRRERANAAPLFAAAATTYAVNCVLGASVALRVIDTSRFRWVHHALYIATCATSTVAVTVGWSRGPHTVGRRAAVVLLPAAVPLAAIPYLGTHTRRHPLVALAASPFLVAGLLLSRSAADRK